MNKLLLVVDMQNDFVSGSLGTKQAQAIVPNVVKKIIAYKQEGVPVFYTIDTHDQSYLQTQEGKNLSIEHCILGTDGHNLCNEIQAIMTKDDVDRTYIKETFGSVSFAEMLKRDAQSLTEIEIVGVVTDICVISNALLLKAYLPQVKITVDAACCAGSTKQLHIAALSVMKSCQIAVVGEADEQ